MLFVGDNAAMMEFFIPEGSVDLTVTSPPYDDMREYTKEAPWDWEAFKRVARQLFSVTKEGGVVVWNVSDKTSKGAKTASSFKQVLHFLELGFGLADTMIWEKTGTSMGSRRLYYPNYEFMFVLSKGPHRVFNPIEDRPNVVKGKQRVGGGGLSQGKSTRGAKCIESLPTGKRNNIWRINPAQRQKGHPAPFPKQLVRDHILSWTNEGDIVFDPFMGSGTTAVAAIETGRRWVGCEVSEEYAEIAKGRIREAKQTL